MKNFKIATVSVKPRNHVKRFNLGEFTDKFPALSWIIFLSIYTVIAYLVWKIILAHPDSYLYKEFPEELLRTFWVYMLMYAMATTVIICVAGVVIYALYMILEQVFIELKEIFFRLVPKYFVLEKSNITLRKPQLNIKKLYKQMRETYTQKHDIRYKYKDVEFDIDKIEPKEY